jgi:hypothetical protein
MILNLVDKRFVISNLDLISDMIKIIILGEVLYIVE